MENLQIEQPTNDQNFSTTPFSIYVRIQKTKGQRNPDASPIRGKRPTKRLPAGTGVAAVYNVMAKNQRAKVTRFRSELSRISKKCDLLYDVLEATAEWKEFAKVQDNLHELPRSTAEELYRNALCNAHLTQDWKKYKQTVDFAEVIEKQEAKASALYRKYKKAAQRN